MRVKRVKSRAGVRATVFADGTLRLFSEQTAAECVCDTEATAMWIALRRHDGECHAAADMLADLWGSDAARVRADMEHLVDSLCGGGFLDVQH
ncbi:PqqD family protein [Streptomyces sp. NPDC051921]|uniref:PqqD family protein n=1 Tax=Streptomyces sp. NPDC051921 TaxID=3155806 RepID=UPI0034196320